MKLFSKNINLNDIKIEDGLFAGYQDLVIKTVLPYMHDMLEDKVEGAEKSHAIENFRIAAGRTKGKFYGMVFQDSDVAKWIEACAYSLCVKPDKELEKTVDEVIEIIKEAQQEDGYLNTFFTVKEPQHKWQNLRECHELYCEGHMIEAAVAYYDATGKDVLLNVMRKMADHTYNVFVKHSEYEDLDVNGAIPGHPEIELALMRLYKVTGDEKYQELAKLFIDNRGNKDSYFEKESQRRGWNHWGDYPEDKEYTQNHKPVREQDVAVGHAVRAVYLYSGMADVAVSSNDEELFDACDTLFNDIANRQIYITGGIGQTSHGEAFSKDYDLPNDTVYAETCASIGLMFFANRMLNIKPCSKYADIMERALYNTVLGGIQLDGKKFFYVNPLEVNPGLSGKPGIYEHVLPVRPKWFGCACCPPNLARLITSLGNYVSSYNDDTIMEHLFVGGSAKYNLAGNEVMIDTITDYPKSGNVKYIIKKSEKEFTLAVRIPGYTRNCDGTYAAKIKVNGKECDITKIMSDGYAYIKHDFKDGDTVLCEFKIEPKVVYANPFVRQDAGKAAIVRGPVTYCVESLDNGNALLQTLRIKTSDTSFKESAGEGMLRDKIILDVSGYAAKADNELYSCKKPEFSEKTIRMIPYYAWGNRGENQMSVWISSRE